MPSANPKVSILLLNCNGLSYTQNCIRSLFAHTSGSFEIIVWDNGSKKQETAALRAEFGDRIRIFRSEKNLGITGGNNAAASHAKGTYFVLLNNDTEVTPNWLDPLMHAMEGDGSLAACQPKLLAWGNQTFFDYSGGCGGFLDRFGYPFTRGRIIEVVEKDCGQYDNAIDVHWGSAACLMVRRDLWEMSGGEDDLFFAYMDEVDLCWQWRNNGYRIRCIPVSKVYHKGSATWHQFRMRQRFLCHRNNLLMILKNTDPLGLITVLLPRIILDVLSAMYYVMRGQISYATAVILGIFSFFFYAPKIVMQKPHRKKQAPLHKMSILFAYFLQKVKRYSDLKLH